jgi:altronate hydrolase
MKRHEFDGATGQTASSQPTKSESFDFGGAEFATWVFGATM